MAEEQENNPKFEFKNIKLGQSQEITLDCAAPVKTGESNFGTWNMWFGFVENAKVTHGRKPDERVQEGYSGKVIMFPATKLNESLVKAANGEVGVKVRITKNAEEGAKGLITRYDVEKLSGGKPTANNPLPIVEQKLVNDLSNLKNEGYNLSEEIAIQASQEPQYENKISVERAKELYALIV